MSDISLELDGETFESDLVLAGSDLGIDDGLKTAVLISLFTDRRAEDDDVPADGSVARRGYWGDSFPDVPGDRTGSRLWLLARSKQLASVVARSRLYVQEALQWLVDDGVARAVNVTAEIVRDEVLGWQIEIQRAAKPVARYRFDAFWKAL